MAYLDPYSIALTADKAAHLLRRATFGPRPQEIVNFTGLTANNAVDTLVSNCVYNLPEPVELDQTRSDRGLPFLHYSADLSRNFLHWKHEQKWWVGNMANQTLPPSLLEKMTLFWQNHFVTNFETVDEYRYLYSYLKLLRDYCLGDFRVLVTKMTKEAAMLRYLNGNQNKAGAPNENYARELQELFVVGQKNFAGNPNYNENDVKEAARILTGWQDFPNLAVWNPYSNPPSADLSFFDASLHDTGNKTFSVYYNNTTIAGQGGGAAGSIELDNLITMLLNHPETPKFICRKIYRWFVHTNVTADIETNVIIPLATLFKNSNYNITPVIKTLLKSQHFYDVSNIGSLVKSPCELLIGSMRFFNLPVPTINTTDVASYERYTNFLYTRLDAMQMTILGQPTVFGYEPYYQIGLSRIWINSTSLAQRGSFTDTIVNGTYAINASYTLQINLMAMTNAAMNNVAGDPVLVVRAFTKNLFATGVSTSQENFLTDTIMMNSLPRTDWAFEYPTTTPAKLAAATSRVKTLMKYLLRMAEYQLF